MRKGADCRRARGINSESVVAARDRLIAENSDRSRRRTADPFIAAASEAAAKSAAKGGVKPVEQLTLSAVGKA